MNLRQELERRISVALSAAGAADAPAMVAPTDPKFGDYKASGVMGAAKRLKLNPRELAARVVALLQKGGANDLSDLAEKIEIAGPGFINITLRKEWLQDRLADLRSDDKLGVTVALAGEVGSSAALASGSRLNVVVDYSAPNLAKEMHVGHLRSTIIGDALARVLEFQGHNVIRQNHVGDWGTQFGMVILGIWQIAMAEHHGELQYIAQTREKLKPLKKDSSLSDRKTALEPIVRRQQDDVFADWDGEKVFHPFILRMIEEKRPLSELLPAYKLVNRCEELAEGTDLTIVTSPNSEVVPFASLSSYVASMLQDFADTRSQNVQEREAWKYARQATIEECQKIYDRMGIQLTELDVRGESYYGGIDQQALVYDADRDMLPSVVSELTAKGLLTASQGAMCVFMPQFMAKDGSPLPLIVQKSNEGYLYATTDLAAICFRIRELKVDRILYVVDKRQSLHFQMVFATTRTAGFAPDNVSLEHVAFGTMMGADGKPFRTRDGETVKLMDLLDEAVKRAYDLVTQKNAEEVAKGRSQPLGEEQKKSIADAVGIGAVKYSDLAQNRNSDYVFSWDKMLAMDGNTAPYMQYAYARIKSIFRKGETEKRGQTPIQTQPRAAVPQVLLQEPAERALAVALLQFSETVATVAADCLPSVLCAYLYDLAGAFTTFYENCPVLKSDEPIRASRLALCELTARTIQKGLELLGIATIEQM